MGGQVTAGISGYSEFAQHIESGRLRAIGISASSRLPGLDVPSLVEQGLDVDLENWRAVVAPPALTEAERIQLTAVVDRMAHSDSWRATLARLGWSDSYLAGPAFDEFLDAERVRIGRIVFGLRGSAAESGSPVGEWIFPSLVLVASAFVLIALVMRRGVVVTERSLAGAPVMRVTAGLVSFVALLNLAGFVLAGTVLFACTASAFGSRRWLRDTVVGLVLCATVYVTFTQGLGVSLPPGAFLAAR
jgi:hypothetical protein